MVESTEVRTKRYQTAAFNRPMDRRIFGQKQVSPRSIVVPRVRLQGSAKMRFTENFSVIQAFALDRTDHPFDVSVIGYVRGGVLTSC